MALAPALALLLLSQAAPPDPARVLEDAGRYREAEPILRRAVSDAEGKPSDALADAAERLADNLAKQARPREAEPLYRRAFEIRLARHGTAHPVVARSLSQLAGLAADAGRLDEAEALSASAVTILTAAGPDARLNLARAQGNRAGILAAMGRHEDGYALYREAAATLQRLGPTAEAEFAVALNNLGSHLVRMAGATSVQAGFRRSFTLRQAVLSPLPPVSAPATGGTEPVDAMLRRRLLFDAAMALRMALSVRVKLLGEMHPDTANSLNGLAAAERALGRRAEAEALYRRALAIKLAMLPSGDRDRVIGAWSLASVIAEDGARAGEARTLYRAAAGEALTAQGWHADYDRAASTELRSFAPIFTGQIRTAWTLANP
jgi:tetratricopeptide (TPR) repeat protein